MAQVAYDLNHFAPGREPKPRVRVAKSAKQQRSARAAQVWRTARLMLGAVVLVFLVCAVLYTQAAVTEVTTEIATKKQELKEEESYNTYLTFELDNKTSLKSIEEAAADMGLSKVNSNQITYFRVEDGDGIQVKQGVFASILQNTRDGFLSILDYFAS